MQRSKILLFSLCFIVQCAFGQSNDIDRLGSNHIKNQSFEEGKTNWTFGVGATIAIDQGFQSSSSLYVKNEDPERKASGTSQKLVIDPGSTLYFKTRVKAKNLQSRSSKPESDGARIYIQAYNEFGKVIGGRYPKLSGVGTFDWKEMSGDFTVPIDAVSISIGLALYPGVTGEAWFDEVFVQTEKPAFIEAFLLKPHYRGVLIENKPQVIQEKVIINRSYYDNVSDVIVTYNLKDIRNKSLKQQEFRIPNGVRDTILTMSLTDGLAGGDYSLHAEYREASKRHNFSRTHKVEVVQNWPLVYIDEEGYTVKDGVKIFPFGLFIGQPEDEHLSRIKNAGFNTVLSYGYGYNKNYEIYLDKAQQYDLNVIYSIKDFYPGTSLKLGNSKPMDVAKEYINNIKYHPSLLAWYTVDELLPTWMPMIQDLYDETRLLDPDHPTLQVHYYDGQKMLEKYYYNADIIATDPYPIGRPDLTLTSTRVAAGYKATHNTKGHWAVLQMMDWAVYQKDRKPNPPDLNELRNQCYQAIIHGAKGILFYTYYDLFQERYPRKNTLDYDNFNKIWPDVELMSQEFNVYIPLFLEGTDYPLHIVNNEKVEVKCLKYKNEYYLIIANPFYLDKKVTIEIPAGLPIQNIKENGIVGNVNGNNLILELGSLTSGVIKLK